MDSTEPMVKIGKSENPESRIKSISTSTPFGLELLAVCEEIEERDLHHKFKHLRINKEWFRFTDEIKDFIFPYLIKKKSEIVDIAKPIKNKKLIDWNVANHNIPNGYSSTTFLHPNTLEMDKIPLCSKGFVSQGIFDGIKNENLWKQCCKFMFFTLKPNSNIMSDFMPYPLWQGSYWENFGSILHSLSENMPYEILLSLDSRDSFRIEIFAYPYFTEKDKFLYSYTIDGLSKLILSKNKEFSNKRDNLQISDIDIMQNIESRTLRNNDLISHSKSWAIGRYRTGI